MSRFSAIFFFAVASLLFLALFANGFAGAAAHSLPQIEGTEQSSTDALGLAILRAYNSGTVGGVGGGEEDSVSSWLVDTTPSYSLGFPLVTPDELRRMTNKELRRFIAERGGRCDGCVEKVHLLERALALRKVPTQNEEIVSMLTPFSTSAPLALTTDLLRPQTTEEITQSHQFAMSNAVLRDHTFYCELVEKNDVAANDGDSNSDGKGEMKNGEAAGKAMHRAPEISCRPRTVEDGPI